MKLKDFIEDIGVPELKAVIGKKAGRLIVLTLIFFISLLVLGVANSSKKILEKKLEDPYIRYIDVELPLSNKTTIKPSDSCLNVTTAEKLIGDSSLNLSPQFSKGTNRRYNIKINNIDSKSDEFEEEKPLGMLLTEDDLFYKDIKLNIGKNKKLLTRSTFTDNGFGLILTEQLFEDFGLKKGEWKDIAFVEIEVNNNYVKLPVAEVVKELRNNCKFAFSKNFLTCESNEKEIFSKDYATYNGTTTYFLKNTTELPNDIHSSFSIIDVPFNLASNCHIKGIMVYSQDTNVFIDKTEAIKVLDIRKVSDKDENDLFDVDYFTFHLNDLSKIEIFADTIEKKFNITIEKSKIEEKKNIDFFDAIMQLLHLTLAVFSILSIILFIINILISHLNSNKRSLGTLKAFGLSNNYIVGLYSSITLFLVGFSFTIAYIATKILGQISLDYFLCKIGMKDEGINYSNFDIWYLFLIMVVVPSFIILFRVFKYLHNVTPGDLIYERK